MSIQSTSTGLKVNDQFISSGAFVNALMYQHRCKVRSVTGIRPGSSPLDNITIDVVNHDDSVARHTLRLTKSDGRWVPTRLDAPLDSAIDSGQPVGDFVTKRKYLNGVANSARPGGKGTGTSSRVQVWTRPAA